MGLFLRWWAVPNAQRESQSRGRGKHSFSAGLTTPRGRGEPRSLQGRETLLATSLRALFVAPLHELSNGARYQSLNNIARDCSQYWVRRNVFP